MLVHIKVTASDSVTVTISLRCRTKRGVVAPPSTSFHPATVAPIRQVDSPLTGTFSTHCHSAFSSPVKSCGTVHGPLHRKKFCFPQKTLLHTVQCMAHCTVRTSVFHKTLYCTRYSTWHTAPSQFLFSTKHFTFHATQILACRQSKRGDPLGRPTLTVKPTHAHAARSN